MGKQALDVLRCLLDKCADQVIDSRDANVKGRAGSRWEMCKRHCNLLFRERVPTDFFLLSLLGGALTLLLDGSEAEFLGVALGEGRTGTCIGPGEE